MLVMDQTLLVEAPLKHGHYLRETSTMLDAAHHQCSGSRALDGFPQVG